MSLRQAMRAAAGGLPPVFWTLWAGMLVNRLASFVGPFLALYLVRQHGYGPEAAGRVVALFGLGVLLSGPLGGALTDRVGRRATMLVGLGLGGACVAGLAFATAPAAIAALSLSASLFGETYRPAAMTVVADVVPVEDRARAYGLVYWAVNLGWAVSLSVAGFIAERSFFALFLADAATSIAFAVLVLRRIPETRPANLPREPLIEGFATTLRDRAFVTFLGLHLAGLLVFSQFQLAAPLDMGRAGIGPAGFSALMALNGVGVVLLQPVLTHRLAGKDPSRSLAVYAVLVGLGFGLYAFVGTWGGFALGVGIWTLGEVIGFPVASALVADLAPAALRGRYQGVYSMTWGLAATLSPILAGQLFDRVGRRAYWLACLAIGLLVALGYLATGSGRRRRLARASG